jgi:hypothetical protein
MGFILPISQDKNHFLFSFTDDVLFLTPSQQKLAEMHLLASLCLSNKTSDI